MHLGKYQKDTSLCMDSCSRIICPYIPCNGEFHTVEPRVSEGESESVSLLNTQYFCCINTCHLRGKPEVMHVAKLMSTGMVLRNIIRAYGDSNPRSYVSSMPKERAVRLRRLGHPRSCKDVTLKGALKHFRPSIPTEAAVNIAINDVYMSVADVSIQISLKMLTDVRIYMWDPAPTSRHCSQVITNTKRSFSNGSFVFVRLFIASIAS